jgi:hypothetical protein
VPLPIAGRHWTVICGEPAVEAIAVTEEGTDGAVHVAAKVGVAKSGLIPVTVNDARNKRLANPLESNFLPSKKFINYFPRPFDPNSRDPIGRKLGRIRLRLEQQPDQETKSEY